MYVHNYAPIQMCACMSVLPVIYFKLCLFSLCLSLALAARLTCLPDCSLNTEKQICDWGPQSTLRRRQRRFCCSLRAYLCLLLRFLLCRSLLLLLSPQSLLCVALDGNVSRESRANVCVGERHTLSPPCNTKIFAWA